MQPQYIQLVGTTPKVVPFNTHCKAFQVTIRLPASATIELAVEDPDDFVQSNSYTPRKAPAGAALTWVAAPAAVNGVIQLVNTPYAACRITPAGDGVATILQQGIK